MKTTTLRLLASSLALCLHAVTAHAAADLHLVFVLDGLRPDSISETDTPNLYRLRREGTWFENAHAVFPSVTRVNAASLGSGMAPKHHGIMGNTMFVPAVDARRAFGNDQHQNLLKLDAATGGQMVTTPGLAERLAAKGRNMVVVSSGSTGSALLLAPKAMQGVGHIINGDLVSGKTVAIPQSLSDAVLARFGAAPVKGGAKDRFDASVDWSMRVLREQVLPEMKPQVVFTWMTEPDHIQHGLGPGAPDALDAIRNDDRQLGEVLKTLAHLGLKDKTNVIVVSDHGFSQTVHKVNVAQQLVREGLMSAPDSGEIVIASSGQTLALHVKDRDPRRIESVVKFLQRQPWCGVVFTAHKAGAPTHLGQVEGSFALDYIGLGGHERSPDIVFSMPWSSEPNAYGVRGSEYEAVGGNAADGPYQGGGANHGGIGPWTIRNTMLATGPDFKRGAVVRTPSSNLDVTPTLLHLLGYREDASSLDGRVLSEALRDGPDHEKVQQQMRTLRVENGSYKAVLQETEVGGKRYLDKAWRID